MKRLFGFILFALLTVLAPPALAQNSFTSCLQLVQPAVNNPATTNAWGPLLNTDMALIDSAVTGILDLSVAGNTNVVLTSNAGFPDQARNQIFIFTGALTGNITIFWPNGLCRKFAVDNATTGSFTVTIAVNNGSGSPAGSTVVVPQGETVGLFDDGTNIVQGITGYTGTLFLQNLTVFGTATGSFTPGGSAGGVLTGSYPNPSGFANNSVGNAALTQGDANTIKGNPTGSTANEQDMAVPSCSGAGQSLNWTSGTGFGCPTITGVPSGAVMPYAGATAPTGWLLAFGQCVSTTTDAALYAVIGDTWTTVDGCSAGNFGIPDMRGRAAFGVDAMGGTPANRLGSGATGGITGTASLGASGGTQSHTLTTNELPTNLGIGFVGQAQAGGSVGTPNSPNTSGGQAHNVLNPAMVLNYIIKL